MRVARALHKGDASTNPNLMKTMNTNHQAAKSTYALLVRSEEEERSFSETAVYLLFIASAVFSIWQVAHQPITLPVDTTMQRAAIAQSATGQHQGV